MNKLFPILVSLVAVGCASSVAPAPFPDAESVPADVSSVADASLVVTQDVQVPAVDSSPDVPVPVVVDAGSEDVAPQPIIHLAALATIRLANADRDLLRFNAYTPSGEVAWKKATFYVELRRMSETSSEVTLSGLRLRRGSTDMPNDAYRIVDGSGNDLRSGTWQSAGFHRNLYVVLSFIGEESLNTQGNDYALHADVAGTVDGDSLQTRFFVDASPDIYVGYLTPDDLLAPFHGPGETLIGPHVHVGPLTGGADISASFVWSPRSSLDHSDRSGTSGGSRDWTNERGLGIPTERQTLTR